MGRLLELAGPQSPAPRVDGDLRAEKERLA
jgi:hypothetical protein